MEHSNTSIGAKTNKQKHSVRLIIVCNMHGTQDNIKYHSRESGKSSSD